jgi:inosose dehydratase
MGIGYTTIMYDNESVKTGLSDIGACRYDGVEVGLEKLLDAGPQRFEDWLGTYDLELYCVMSSWLESETAVETVTDRADLVADLGAEYLGLLPPQRGNHDDETLDRWLTRVAGAAEDAGLTPVVHHHGGTHVEGPEEIDKWLDRTPENVGLLFDTAHYYPYGDCYPDGDVTDGIRRFADDIEYVHLKDVEPVSEFTQHRDALSTGDFHLDNVINYFRTFTDLGDGLIDFEKVADTVDEVDYDGQVTVEIENRTERPLVHAKRNYDYWQEIVSCD